MVENETFMKIKCLRSDNGGEFTSNEFNEFCETHGIKRKFSAAKDPQQNNVVERKNRTVQEAAKTMLNEAKLSDAFWKEVVYIAVYILNRGKLIVNKDKTPYELWYGRPTSIKYFKLFSSSYYIKRNEDDLGKFESRIDDGIFLRYSSTKKEYKCYNKSLHKIVKSADVKVDDIKPRKEKKLDNVENTCDDEIKYLQ